MKNNIFSRTFIIMIAALILMGGFSVTAYAGGGEEIPSPETIEPTAEPESPPNPVALTPDGNLTLVDDIQGERSEDKQYMTVVTKNGNYFYIIIDRAGDKENVYFLNMVDEADLLALIEDDKQPSKPVITPQPEPDQQPTIEPEPEPQKKSSAGSAFLLLLIVAGAGGGAFYYFKVLKPKQATQGGRDLSELDELDFDDEDDGLLSMDEAEPSEDGDEE